MESSTRVTKIVSLTILFILIFEANTEIANPNVNLNNTKWTVDIITTNSPYRSTFLTESQGFSYSNLSNQLYVEENANQTTYNRLVGFHTIVSTNASNSISLSFEGKATGNSYANYNYLDVWLFKTNWTNATITRSDWLAIAGQTNENNVWIYLAHTFSNLEPNTDYILMIGYFDHWGIGVNHFNVHQQVWAKNIFINGIAWSYNVVVPSGPENLINPPTTSSSIYPINLPNILSFNSILELGFLSSFILIVALVLFFTKKRKNQFTVQRTNQGYRNSPGEINSHQNVQVEKSSISHKENAITVLYTKNCLVCGNKVLKGDVFCHNCGNRI